MCREIVEKGEPWSTELARWPGKRVGRAFGIGS
jgi:hypothetical protein